MTDLNELRFFVYVCRSRSFTLAAQQLGVPKSTVSRAIRRLELRIGVRLVERTTRSVALTEAGQIYYDHCRRVIEEAEQADLAMGALVAEPRGKLRVAVPSAFARARLTPILGTFLTRYPEIRLELQFTGETSLQRHANLDVVIRAGRLEDSGLLVRTLAPVRIGVYASPGYLSGKTRLEAPVDLRLHSCITSNCGNLGSFGDATIWKLRRGNEVKEVCVEARVSVPDPAIGYQLAVEGTGVALLSQEATLADVERGRLVRILPDWEPEPVELHALYPSRLNSSPKVRAFLQFLREQFSADPSMTTLKRPA